MASQPFVGRRVWQAEAGCWSVRFRDHRNGFATMVTGARTRHQAEQIADALEAREQRTRVLLLAVAAGFVRP